MPAERSPQPIPNQLVRRRPLVRPRQNEGGADESSQGVGGASAPTASTSPTPRPSMGTALRDVIRKLQLLGKPGQRPAGAKPTAVPVAADTETDNTESDLTSAVTDPVASDSMWSPPIRMRARR